MEQAPPQATSSGHAAVVRLVTVFENFLYDCIQRAVFINPQLINKSDIKIDASEVSTALVGQSARAWFAHYIADKYCRSKTPDELISRVDQLLQAGISKRLEDFIREWVQWTLVRNAVVHLGGDITRELAAKWPSRFTRPGAKIEISYKDVLRVAYLSREIACALDGGQIPRASRVADRDLIAAELFVRKGVDDPSTLSVVVTSFLSVRTSREEAARLIAKFRRESPLDEGFTISDEMIAAAMSASHNVRQKSSKK